MHKNLPARRNRRGFTLMELLLVMAILLLLLGLVASRFIGTQKKANSNAAQAQIRLFKGALDNYALDMGSFPSTEQGLIALREKPADVENADKWGGPYLDGELPKDPWQRDFQYAYPPTKNKDDFPDIWSLGADGEEGSEDDIGNWPAEDSESTSEASK